jgi:hypothetical protein
MSAAAVAGDKPRTKRRARRRTFRGYSSQNQGFTGCSTSRIPATASGERAIDVVRL